MKSRSHLLLILSLCPALAIRAAETRFAVNEDAHGFSVSVDGKPFATYWFDQCNKPCLWPIYGPTGKAMTRAFPMQEVEYEAKSQRDHYHHRGMTFGHDNIGGWDTWSEAGSYGPPPADPAKAEGRSQRLAKLGTIRHKAFTETNAGNDKAFVAEVCEYVGTTGQRFLTEERRLTFRANGDTRSIDFEQDLIATDGDVTFEDKKDAGLSIRVPASMAVDAKLGGTIVNSDGVTDKDAWSKAAKWCDYNGPVEGERLGIAFLNHPSSFRYPTRWHVRTYGLFTANPFASAAYDKSLADGTTLLKSGERLKLRHRFIFHKGDAAAAQIEKAYEAYANEQH